jgi:hypothetical protein
VHRRKAGPFHDAGILPDFGIGDTSAIGLPWRTTTMVSPFSTRPNIPDA